MRFGFTRGTLASLVVAAGLVAIPNGLTSPASAAVPVAAAVPVLRDGSTSALAAASCWEIKQNVPASVSGVYWLQTPQLIAPQQFYCDQVTDGGGWVLVGRGRDGWQWTQNGQGSAANVRNIPAGTGAFAPATVSGDTIDALLGGTRVDALADGIRVRRATNATGTTYQEMRLRTTSRSNWSWAIGGGERLSSVTVDGATYSGALNSQSWSANGSQTYARLTTNEIAAHNYRKGFSYGTLIGGSNNATSYLWEYTTENQALPFSQVYLRPKITTPAYSAIPDTGTAASTVRALLNNKTSPATTWGVTGLASGGAGGEVVEVEDIAFIGRTAYVAGKFQYVQKGANPAPADKIQQSYLAAFNIDTGEWMPNFRPVLNATAWALAVTPDNKLVVGGEFTSVNGVANTSSLAEVDPLTGAVVDGWRAPVSYVGNDTPNVRSLSVQGNWLYIGGRYNRIAGGATLGTQITLRSMARVNALTSTPDAVWKPNVDGTVFEVDASARGDRVYFVGNFNNVNFTSSPMRGVVSTDGAGANVAGLAAWIPSVGSGTQTYQQTILEVGDNVWQGGSQHILTKYTRDNYTALSSNITRNGGDFQALAEVDGVVYGSCHCVNYAYSGTTNYSTPITGASDVNSVRFIGAWDAATGAFLPDFYVSSLSARNDMGPWALRKDPDGCMWFGGDFTGGSYVGSTQQWLGGFGKLCPRDTTAPTTPTSLVAKISGSAVNLTWGASTDASTLSYEIMRDDRVIATTTGRSYSDTGATLPAKYWVRAVDELGNRSASTPAAQALGADVTAPTVSVTAPVAGATPFGDTTLTADATDDRGVASVQFTVDGVNAGAAVTAAPYSTTWSATVLGSHTIAAVATDAAGNATTSAPVTVTVTADTVAPSQVTGLTVTSTQADRVALSWAAASDDRGVTGYQVTRNGTALPGTVAATTFTDSPLTAATTYSYTVRAVDGAGNLGPASAAVSATTAGDPAVIYTDSWSGTDGSAWTAPWATSVGSGSVTTSGGKGILSFSDVSGAYARAQLGTTAAADTELTTSFRWNENTANSFLTVYLRGSGGWQNSYRPKNGYGLQLTPTSGTVAVVKNVNGVTSTIRSVAGAQTVGTGKQWLRLRVSGSTIQFKVWKDGTSEPAGWTSTDTDTAVTAAGQAFISLNRSSTNVGTKTVELDDLTLRSVTG